MPQSSQAATAVLLSPKIRSRQNRTRERIIAVSAHRFAAKGFENVSVEEIIADAEIARSSFYRFFSNREQVLANIIRPVFERGLRGFRAITSDDAHKIMHGIFMTYLSLWHASPDALRVSTQVGRVYFYLFEDTHNEYRVALLNLLEKVEPAGILINDSADYTGRLLARTAIPVLEVYRGDRDLEDLFLMTMRGMLLKPPKNS